MKKINMLPSLPMLCVLALLMLQGTGCSQPEDQARESFEQQALSQSEENRPLNTLTAQEKEEGWQLLFDGETADGWRKAYGDTFPSDGWIVKDGMLTVLESDGRQGGGAGSIVTENQYSDFELQLDFKLTKGANSGIKYFVVENPDFFEGDPAGRGIGLEYQVLDDENHPDAKQGVNGNRTVASLYDLIPASKDKHVNPIGEWNHVRLVSNGNHVEHWLNGEKVLEYERGSEEFNALVKKSKYSGYENFGLAPQGHVLLQDHGNRVSYRNIKIKKLDKSD